MVKFLFIVCRAYTWALPSFIFWKYVLGMWHFRFFAGLVTIARVGSLQQAKIGYFSFLKALNRGKKLLGCACNSGSKICHVNHIILSLWLEWINWDDSHGSHVNWFSKNLLKITILLFFFSPHFFFLVGGEVIYN